MTSWSFRPEGRSPTVHVSCGSGVWREAPPAGALPDTDAAVLVVDGGLPAPHRRALEAWVLTLAPRVAAPVVLPGGEAGKDVDALPRLWRVLATHHPDRRTLLIGAGGGATLDVAGFLAATFLRGLPYVAVPTTLLAQVDAGLGGKCGVNLDGAKNQVGAIHQPHLIAVETDVLATLPESEWESGLGEVAKTALLAGGGLLEAVRALGSRPRAGHPGIPEVVAGCLCYKASVVAEDPHEAGRRAVLNLGHTVGHVLEGLAAAAGTSVPHGCAVAAGLVAEAHLLSDAPVADAVRTLVAGLGLPTQAVVRWDEARAVALLGRDKKRRGDALTVPYLEALGRPVLRPVAQEALLTAVRAAAAVSD